MKTSRLQLSRLIARQTLAEQPNNLAKQVAAYLISEHRTGELASLMRDVQAERAEHGYVEVVAHCAHELSEGVRRDIEAEARQLFPAARHVTVTEQLEPDLIGGVRLEIVDRQLDLSTRGQLQKFKMLAARGKE